MIYIIIWLLIGVVCALLAKTKSRSVIGWFILGVLGGIFTFLILMVLPKKGKSEKITIQTSQKEDIKKLNRKINIAIALAIVWPILLTFRNYIVSLIKKIIKKISKGNVKNEIDPQRRIETKMCPHCKTYIENSAEECPHCYERL